MANFKKNTRYTNGKVEVNRSDKSFLVLRSALDLPLANTDTSVTITQDLITRPDLISFKAYGTPDLWWVIYEYNGIFDPVFQLQPGQLIRIPEIGRVLEAVARINK